MKSKYLLLSALSIFTLAGCGNKESETLDTATVSTGNLSETVTATGTLESVTSVDVGTQVTGIISELYADFNSVVKKGELIAEIEKTILDADLRSAEANVESAKLTYDYNLANYNRDKALYDKQLISEYEFQTSTKDLKVSKAAYDKALADRVRAAKNLNYAEIYSPIDGIVISREVEVGQTVVSNMSVANLYTIADLDNMQVVGNVDEADIGQVKVGQRVTFTVDAYPDIMFDGSVTQVRLNPTTESNVVTYEVIVSTSNPDHKLIPGLTANLTIYVMEVNDAILVPAAAFNFTPQQNDDNKKLPQADNPIDPKTLSENQKTLWVVDGNRLINKAVTIGTSNGIYYTIESGINKGDVVATGYTTVAAEGGSQARSPFTPQPPGSKKK